jgi:cyanate permease
MSTLPPLSALVSPALVLAAMSDDLDPEIEENLTPGWVGALVILALIAVTVLLWLSMRRQFRKIRFDQDEPPDEPGPDDEPDRER